MYRAKQIAMGFRGLVGPLAITQRFAKMLRCRFHVNLNEGCVELLEIRRKSLKITIFCVQERTIHAAVPWPWRLATLIGRRQVSGLLCGGRVSRPAMAGTMPAPLAQLVRPVLTATAASIDLLARSGRESTVQAVPERADLNVGFLARSPRVIAGTILRTR
jgi:hypothetical protein